MAWINTWWLTQTHFYVMCSGRCRKVQVSPYAGENVHACSLVTQLSFQPPAAVSKLSIIKLLSNMISCGSLTFARYEDWQKMATDWNSLRWPAWLTTHWLSDSFLCFFFVSCAKKDSANSSCHLSGQHYTQFDIKGRVLPDHVNRVLNI